MTYWPYGVTDVILDSAPTNPPDGEQVVEVLVLPASEAAEHVAVHDAIHADLIRLAAEMGLA